MIRKWTTGRFGALAGGILVKVLVAVLVMVGVSYLTSEQDRAMQALHQKAEIIKLKLQLTGVK